MLVELLLARTALDLESKKATYSPNRPRRIFIQDFGRKPNVACVLGLLRPRQAGTSDSAVQVYRRRQLSSPRVFAAMARRKLQGRRNRRPQVQSLFYALRNSAD